jgi:eukaryotic-like serine/threonine-protein kinase
MEGIVAILATFGTPVLIVFTVVYYRYRTRELALREKQAADPRKLEASEKEKKLLEQRIQNLESIVCSVDFELNQRLNRLASQASIAARALPAPSPSAGGAAVGGSSGTAVNTTPLPTAELRPGGTLAAGAAPVRAELSHHLGQLSPGQVVLGRYTIERELGRGGMGAVYLAQDSKLGERVALKTISSALAGDPSEMVVRFRREVQAARLVTHSNVIRIHDLNEDGALLFLSMEYVDGETLHSRVKRMGALDVPEAREILAQVAAGVAAAHAAGVVHRDLKPQNVLLSTDGGVKVIDFGLAKTTYTAGMTATGMILGTPEYMAPEQIRGSRSDARTDVYALGATAYFTLCGRPPFEGDTPIAVGFAQVHEAPRPPRELRPEIPIEMEGAILRSLNKDPAKRYSDGAEWRKAISAGVKAG